MTLGTTLAEALAALAACYRLASRCLGDVMMHRVGRVEENIGADEMLR